MQNEKGKRLSVNLSFCGFREIQIFQPGAVVSRTVNQRRSELIADFHLAEIRFVFDRKPHRHRRHEIFDFLVIHLEALFLFIHLDDFAFEVVALGLATMRGGAGFAFTR